MRSPDREDIQVGLVQFGTIANLKSFYQEPPHKAAFARAVASKRSTDSAVPSRNNLKESERLKSFVKR